MAIRIDAAGSGVLATEERFKALRHNDFNELKAMHSPPPGVKATALAAKILLGREDVKAGADAHGMTFGSSKTIMLVIWMDSDARLRRRQMVYDNPIPKSRLERLEAMEAEDEAYTVERTARCSPAAAAVCAYIQAAVHFYRCIAGFGGDGHGGLTINAWKFARGWDPSGNI